MVCLSNHNFEPEWGDCFFNNNNNNSVGEVEEIVFNDGDNPNAGDQPCYIAQSSFSTVQWPSMGCPETKGEQLVKSLHAIVRVPSQWMLPLSWNERHHGDITETPSSCAKTPTIC